MTNEEISNEIVAIKKRLLQKRKELATNIAEFENELHYKRKEFDSALYKMKNDFAIKKVEINESINELNNELRELNFLFHKTREFLPEINDSIPLKEIREKLLNEFVNKSVDLTKILETDNYQIASYNLNTRSRMLVKGASTVKLTNKEMFLLATFAANLNQLIPREYLLDTVWDDDAYYMGRTMDVYISKLRKHLQDDTMIRFENVHGIGYKLLIKG